jgi:hypothetical protein
MKSLIALAASTCILLATPVAASVAPGPGLSSSNVEYVSTIPIEAGTWSTARVHGEYLYVSGTKSFSIYDISDPLAPVLASHTVTGIQFVNEDIDTNGEILLLSDERARQRLIVYDVSNKKSPQLLAEIEGIVDHTYACVLDCRWAYGAGGNIVDLRDPAAPKVVGSWAQPTEPLWGFDTTEVAPGLVMTGSRVMHLLDGRKDPAEPELLASAGTDDHRLIHSVQWPQKGKDRFLLVQGETSPKPACDANSGALMTWDATKWKKTHSFIMIDEYRVPSGVVADGNPPASALGCSASWFQPHPAFKDGGLLVGGFFDHGTRFLEVASDGQIGEVGYFTPIGGSTTAAVWVNEEIVYSIDIGHGIDILRFHPGT